MAARDNDKTPVAGPAKIKGAANSITVAVAVIAGIFGINIVANRVFGRVDLTEDHIYKLSDTSRDAVKSLSDPLTVKAYISSGLQPPLNQYGRYVRDLLDEYATASGGKFQWEAIDPLDGTKEEKDAKKEELTKYHIQKITLERISEAKLEIGSDNYLGIGLMYGGEIESVPQVISTERLEFEITSKIKKLTGAKKKKLAFATSEGELQPSQGMQLISQVLKDYDTTTITLDKPIADDIDGVVIAGPKQPFKDAAKYYLDQFLMKGKSVAFFVSGMVIEAPNGMNMNIPGMEQPKMGRANDVALTEYLDKYGVKVRDDLILDEAQNAPGIVSIQGRLHAINHPVFLASAAKKGDLAEKLPLTDHVQLLILPFASSVELTGDLKDNKVAGVTATVVAKSSPDAWRQSGFFLFNPPVVPQKSGESGRFNLGYAITGKLKSAFPSGAPAGADAGTALKESQGDSRLLVLGDSDLIADDQLRLVQQVQAYGENVKFFVNTVDWLLHDESLISLRAKGMTSRPLTLTYDGKVKFWEAFDIVGIPLLLILFGIVLWQVRSARRRAVQL